MFVSTNARAVGVSERGRACVRVAVAARKLLEQRP